MSGTSVDSMEVEAETAPTIACINSTGDGAFQPRTSSTAPRRPAVVRLVITIDIPLAGKREHNTRNGFHFHCELRRARSCTGCCIRLGASAISCPLECRALIGCPWLTFKQFSQQHHGFRPERIDTFLPALAHQAHAIRAFEPDCLGAKAQALPVFVRRCCRGTRAAHAAISTSAAYPSWPLRKSTGFVATMFRTRFDGKIMPRL